ncbi:MAG: Rab family GTPase [Candidatus Hodarchaeales archaeon]
MGEEGTSRKIILIGDGGTGKTSLVNRFVHRKFSSIYKTTIGVDITPYRVSIKDSGKSVRFVLWDMSGQTHFERFRVKFYTGTSGALVVYDLTRATSLRNVPSWIKECHDNCRKKVPIILVGNKSDIVDLRILNAKPPSKEFPNFVTSAKDSSNVDKAFFSLFETVLGNSIERKRDQSAQTTHLSYEKSKNE